MSLSCNCCWGILWDYFILFVFFVVSAIRDLSKLKCHTVAKKKNDNSGWWTWWRVETQLGCHRNISLIFWWILTCSGSILTWQNPININHIPSFLRAFWVMASFYVRRKSSHVDTIDIVTLYDAALHWLQAPTMACWGYSVLISECQNQSDMSLAHVYTRKTSWETTLIFQRANFVILCPLPHSATLPALLEVLQEISVGGRTSRDHSKSLDGPKWRACPSNLR